MFIADTYTPTRVRFGPGKLKELATCKLPGKKALICVTEDGLMEKLGLQSRVLELLKQNGVEAVVYDKITPNPTRTGVMNGAALAKKEGCDFILGLGGGSSIDSAKGIAIMVKNPGDLWDYASVGSGGKKAVTGALPVVTVSTTSGTGTETDPYCVITKEETGEKLDFTLDEIFPVLSIIDPELMKTLPRNLTTYQGFDALFHVAECYISNENENRMATLYTLDGVKTVAGWLATAVKDGSNLEARTHMAYVADILAGYSQAIINTTSHHIIGQTIGGMFPKVPHGLSLLFVAEAYYNKVKVLRPELLDELGEAMGVKADPSKPGEAFVTALTSLLDETGIRKPAMSEYGITPDHFERIAEVTVDVVGIDFEKYTITKADIVEMLKASYR